MFIFGIFVLRRNKKENENEITHFISKWNYQKMLLKKISEKNVIDHFLFVESFFFCFEIFFIRYFSFLGFSPSVFLCFSLQWATAVNASRSFFGNFLSTFLILWVHGGRFWRRHGKKGCLASEPGVAAGHRRVSRNYGRGPQIYRAWRNLARRFRLLKSRQSRQK